MFVSVLEVEEPDPLITYMNPNAYRRSREDLIEKTYKVLALKT